MHKSGKLIFSVVFCISFGLVATELTEAQLQERESSTLETFRQQCVNRDFASQRCNLVVQTADMYQPTMLALPSRAGLGIVGGLTELAQGSIDVARWAYQGDSSFAESTTGRRIRGTIVGELRRMMAEENINPCHKACMIKCATDAVLDYGTHLDAKFGSLGHIYELGEGECTEFQRVALDLASALDVPASPRYGVRHAFVGFDINGLNYAAEPQNSSCDFFFQEELSESLLSEREEILNRSVADHTRHLAEARAAADEVYGDGRTGGGTIMEI